MRRKNRSTYGLPSSTRGGHRPILANPQSFAAIPKKSAMPEGIKCFHCQGKIKDNEDYFGIFRKSYRGANVNFHVQCFENVAGEEYTTQLEYAVKECRKCGSSGGSTNRILCNACNSAIAPCEKCGSDMRPRINSHNQSVFLGCSAYPGCRNIRRL
jgi:ssDNA-binding Zn-finger/Zn-ribbon topoisomerase 1